MTAMAVETGHVGCSRLADGMLIQLGGVLGPEQLVDLRATLLVPLAPECRDVVIDAGDVDAVDDSVLAVLLAACEWSEIQGVRFLLSRASEAMEEALLDAGMDDALPRLSELPTVSRGVQMPQQRSGD